MNRLRLSLLMAAGAAMLAGCVTDPGPIVTETPSPGAGLEVSASPSASPDAELSTEELLALMPPGAERDDVQGAVVTAEFFLSLYAPMYHSGDTTVWDALSGEDCQFCSGQSGNALEVHDLGWQARGGEIVPRSGSIQAGVGEDGLTYVTLLADLETAILIDPDGNEEIAEEASTVEYSFQLDRVGETWIVLGVMREVQP